MSRVYPVHLSVGFSSSVVGSDISYDNVLATRSRFGVGAMRLLWYLADLAPAVRFNPTALRRSAISRPFHAFDNERMAEYRYSAHAVFDLNCHVIWCTKYRYKILRGRIAERARDPTRQICEARDVVIVRVQSSRTIYTCCCPLRRSCRRRR